MAEGVKAWLALRYEQAKRLAPAISLLMNTATLTLVAAAWLYDYAWAGAWVIPTLATSIMAAIVAVPWLYYDAFGMRIHERNAHLNLDPMQQDRLTPKERRLLSILTGILEGDPEARHDLHVAITTGVIP